MPAVAFFRAKRGARIGCSECTVSRAGGHSPIGLIIENTTMGIGIGNALGIALSLAAKEHDDRQ